MLAVLLPKDHRGLTARSWLWVGKGLKRCLADPEAKRKCLDWIDRMTAGGNGAGLERWREILERRHHERVREALEAEDFFSLPDPSRNWWDRFLQDHPLCAIFAEGRHRELQRKLPALGTIGDVLRKIEVRP